LDKISNHHFVAIHFRTIKNIKGKNMQKNPLIQIWVTIGIILLFVETCIIPAIAQNTEKQSTSRGNWLYVGGSGPGNYSRIQDAIDNASDGDTVFVYDDSSPYNESVSIIYSIRLLGENPTSTIITNQKYSVIRIFANNVTIEGFTITTMNYDYNGIQCKGNFSMITNNIINSGGISFYNTYNTTITHNIIQGKRGIYISESIVTKIENNSISVQHTGIELLRSSMIFIANNCLNNFTQGIMLIESSSANVSDNIISNATSFGIYIQDTLETNQIIGNTVTSCNRGIFFCVCENQIIKNNTIRDSELGINLSEANHNLIAHNIFSGNTVNALFTESYKNKWSRNFWDRPRTLPYTIAGTVIIYKWSLKWFNFDWHPAQEPYDIPGMS
jgi:parallel beta-helix repeat protein